jgi:hypothetical protein
MSLKILVCSLAIIFGLQFQALATPSQTKVTDCPANESGAPIEKNPTEKMDFKICDLGRIKPRPIQPPGGFSCHGNESGECSLDQPHLPN